MDIEAVFERWGDGVIIDDDLTAHSVRQASAFLAKKAGDIHDLAESEPDQAFAELLQLVAFVNTVSRRRPDILRRLADLVTELKRALNRIAEKKEVDSYSISAGVPFGVSVSLSWAIDTID